MKRLAIDGGRPACPGGLPVWPHYDEDEIAAVVAVLRSGKVNQWTGDQVRNFEAACAAAFGQPHAIALANGTLALELALKALGIGPGDEVIVTPRSFIASASCVVSVGATPVFADVDPLSQNITPASIEAVAGPRCKAAIPVHLNGWPCDMPGIMALAARRGFKVIEDCAQAHGGSIDGRPLGSFGDAAAFSFCQDKIISTGGEGGLTLFRKEADWRTAWSLKDHGKAHDTVFDKPHPPGFRWLHESIGSNWRLTGPQAAIGLAQLAKLPDWHEQRKAIAGHIAQTMASCPALAVPQPSAGNEHAWYRFSFQVDESRLAGGWNHGRLRDAISAEGVRCLEVCPEIYREKAFDDVDMPAPHCPQAVALGRRALMLPIHPTLDKTALAAMSGALDKVLRVACATRSRSRK